MRVTVVLSSLALGLSLVAGCGSGGGDDSSGSQDGGYCQDLKAAKSDFASLGSGSPDVGAFGDAIKTFHHLADEAPPAVADDWKTLDEAFTTLESDLEDAGLTMKDLGAITQGQLPDGMTQADLADLGPKLEETFGKLDDPKFEEASTAIEKHAKSTCHVDLTKN
jgi:hypothetical protein